MDEPRVFTATEALTYGWDETKKRFTTLFLALGALTLILEALGGSAQRAEQGLLHLVLQVASMLVTMGWWRIALRVHDGGAPGLDALREVTFLQAVHYFLAIALFWIAVIVGFVMLVLPGLVLGARLFLAPAIVIDEGRDPISALRRSAELTEGRVIPVLVLGIFLFGLNLIGAIPFGLGLLVTIPVSFLAVVHVYRRLQQHHDATGTYRTAAPSGA
jgi:hypothetical protein